MPVIKSGKCKKGEKEKKPYHPQIKHLFGG